MEFVADEQLVTPPEIYLAANAPSIVLPDPEAISRPEFEPKTELLAPPGFCSQALFPYAVLSAAVLNRPAFVPTKVHPAPLAADPAFEPIDTTLPDADPPRPTGTPLKLLLAPANTAPPMPTPPVTTSAPVVVLVLAVLAVTVAEVDAVMVPALSDDNPLTLPPVMETFDASCPAIVERAIVAAFCRNLN